MLPLVFVVTSSFRPFGLKPTWPGELQEARVVVPASGTSSRSRRRPRTALRRRGQSHLPDRRRHADGRRRERAARHTGTPACEHVDRAGRGFTSMLAGNSSPPDETDSLSALQSYHRGRTGETVVTVSLPALTATSRPHGPSRTRVEPCEAMWSDSVPGPRRRRSRRSHTSPAWRERSVRRAVVDDDAVPVHLVRLDPDDGSAVPCPCVTVPVVVAMHRRREPAATRSTSSARRRMVPPFVCISRAGARSRMARIARFGPFYDSCKKEPRRLRPKRRGSRDRTNRSKRADRQTSAFALVRSGARSRT